MKAPFRRGLDEEGTSKTEQSPGSVDELSSAPAQISPDNSASTTDVMTQAQTTLDDLPQEILDHIFPFLTPTFCVLSHSTIQDAIYRLQWTQNWLLRLSLLNSRWYRAIYPLLHCTVVLCADRSDRDPTNTTLAEYDARLRSQIEGVKCHPQTVKHLILRSVFHWNHPSKLRTEILDVFQECLAACTELQSLDVISEDDLPSPPPLDAQSILSALFSHISSTKLHTLAIRSENPDKAQYHAHAWLAYVLLSTPLEVTRCITQLYLQTWDVMEGTLDIDLSQFRVTFPALCKLNLSFIKPFAFSTLDSILTKMTRPTSTRGPTTSISELSLIAGTARLTDLNTLLAMNNLGQNLSFIHLQFAPFVSDLEYDMAPESILTACPNLQTFLYFVLCPTLLFDVIPTGLVELGLLVAKDPQMSSIFQMAPIVNWSNDERRRRDVKKLVIDWEEGVLERKVARDRKTLRSCHKAVEVVFVDIKETAI